MLPLSVVSVESDKSTLLDELLDAVIVWLVFSDLGGQGQAYHPARRRLSELGCGLLKNYLSAKCEKLR